MQGRLQSVSVSFVSDIELNVRVSVLLVSAEIRSGKESASVSEAEGQGATSASHVQASHVSDM